MVQVEAAAPPLRRGRAAPSLLRFAGWMLQVDPARGALVLALRIVQGASPAATVWLSARVFAEGQAVWAGRAAAAAMLGWLGAWGAVGLLEVALWPLFELASNAVIHDMEDAATARLQAKAGVLRLEAYERPDFHDILRRAREACDPGMMLNLVWNTTDLPQNAVTLLAVGGLVGHWSPTLLPAVVVAALPQPISEIVQARARHFRGRKQTADERLRGYYGTLLSNPGAAKEVRTFDLQAWCLARWRGLFWKVADEIHRQERAQTLARAGLNTVALLGYAAGLAVAARGLAAGDLPAARFAALLLALRSVQGAAEGIAMSLLGWGGELLLKVGDLFAYLDLGPKEPAGGARPDPSGDIVLEGVGFTYPGKATPALQGVSCVLRSGERVALVGENGSGKTTLVKLLCGLYRPTEGRVLYGGRDMAELHPQALRDLQAAVFQDHVRYAFTLGENIGLGRAEQVADRETVRRAAELGGADAVAASLPQGYATPLTREFEGGTDLSGGQWQRIAVSRGFMRQAPLVVLDEPTASLDPRAEAEVFRSFAQLAGGGGQAAGPNRDATAGGDAGSGPVTAVLVSHRLGSARLCDRVLVLEGGRLVEQGRHDELVAAGGPYARLWAVQSQWYR